ncbi:MAG: MFS transporter, partial [Verrucomicrobia bacterium 21-51-4]
MQTGLAKILARNRLVLLILVFLMLGGMMAYRSMPRESDPDIPIPAFSIVVSLEGVSPEDAERLLIRPLETQLRSLEGLKEIQSTAQEGFALIVLEYDAGVDCRKALEDVRIKVDLAKPDLPKQAQEPIIQEYNTALSPILAIGLGGPVPERTLQEMARELRDKLETLPEVLSVDIQGLREDLVEIQIDPALIDLYQLKIDEVLARVQRNNQLVAAGSMDTGHGRMSIKVPGLYEELQDILDTPIKVSKDRVVRLSDVAQITKSYKDPMSYARINGQPALVLEVKKRIGKNVIHTIEAVKAVSLEESKHWPALVQMNFFQDQSNYIRQQIADLENSLLLASMLVMGVVIWSLGWRAACLVGFAIPGSFLFGLWILDLMGISLNSMVLFSLILSVGMLVDGAVIVVEFADRKMLEGFPRFEAFSMAAQRMYWPILSSTATTIAAFVPMLFWPGIVGEYLSYLPITLICTLAASLAMAFIFVPCLGSLFGKPGHTNPEEVNNILAAQTGDFDALKGISAYYVRLLKKAIGRPGIVLVSMCSLLIVTYVCYGLFGRGLEFFPSIDPEYLDVKIHMRGDLSIDEMDAIVRQVEHRIHGIAEIKSVRAASYVQGPRANEDVHGSLSIELIDWRNRCKADTIIEQIHQRTADIAGVNIEVSFDKGGPPVGKAIAIELSARDSSRLPQAVEHIIEKMKSMPGITNIEDTRSAGGVEWCLDVNRVEASRYGADITSVGDMVQFLTTGYLVATYRPSDVDDEVDIRVRYPAEMRNLTNIEALKIPTSVGLVPASYFLDFAPAPKVSQIERINGRRVLQVKADVASGYLADDQVRELRRWLKEDAALDPSIFVQFKGEDEEQRESQGFLGHAFLAALGIIAVILVAQFNSFYDTLLVLTAVVFSTI